MAWGEQDFFSCFKTILLVNLECHFKKTSFLHFLLYPVTLAVSCKAQANL
jgi:hypothetical protein